MTATPPDPLATQHDGNPDPDGQGPADTQTQRLQEENRALRELLAAQVHASLPRQEPGWFRRLGWWLISAPGAALVGWRSLFGRDDGEPITGRRVGCATLTVIYTLAIYGALVLLVVSWNSPNTAPSGATAAGPVRVPLTPPSTQPPESNAAGKGAAPSSDGGQGEKAPGSAADRPETDASSPPLGRSETDASSSVLEGPNVSSSVLRRPETDVSSSELGRPETDVPSSALDRPETDASSSAPDHASPAASSRGPARTVAPPSSSERTPTAPQPSLRITEIPAPDPMAWVAALDGELARCAEMGFFDRPECAWTARKQFCEPNQGWGKVKECPAQP